MTDQSYSLFVAVHGHNGEHGPFAQHVFAAYLMDAESETPVWSNEVCRRELWDGSQAAVLYKQLLACLPHVPKGAEVTILSPQDFVVTLFSSTRDERRAANYKTGGKHRKPRPHRDTLRAIDDEAEARGVTLRAKSPELHAEHDRLREVSEAAKEAWAALGQGDG